MKVNTQDENHFRIPVPAAFEDVFTHFYFARNTGGQPLTQILLPSFQTIMLFNFGVNVFINSKQNTQLEVAKCLF